MKVEEIKRDDNGKLPAWAWPSGYTMIYLDHGGNILCADCATKSLRYNDDESACDGDIYWDGPTLQCEGCNCDIESSYGDPENQD